MPLVGAAQTEKELKAELAALEAAAVVELKRGVNVCFETLLAATPVWTGETVANYHTAIGESAGGGRREAVDTGPTGATNKMPLGSEPRRAANETLSRQEKNAVVSAIGKNLVNVTISNTVDEAKWDMIDNGAAPGGPPGYPLGPDQQRRAPGGVSRVAQQTVRSNGNWK